MIETLSTLMLSGDFAGVFFFKTIGLSMSWNEMSVYYDW